MEKFERYLVAANVLTQDEVDTIRAEITKEVEDAVAVSEAAPYPDVAATLDPSTMLYPEEV